MSDDAMINLPLRIERYHALFEKITNPVLIIDAQGNYVDCNAAALEFLECSSDELLKMNVHDFAVPGEDEREARDQHRLLWKHGGTTETKYYVHGQVKALELTITPATWRGQEVILGVGKDVTERKRVEEELQRHNRELALLNQASRAFTSTLDLDRVLATVLEDTRCLMNVAACSVWLLDSETGELVCRQATGPKSEMVRGWRLAPGEGLAGWVVRHRQNLIVPDAQADERYFNGVDQQTGLTLRSILTIPLRTRESLIGALQVVDAQVNRFDESDLALLEPLAANAASAIENARLYEQAQLEIAERKRTEEALREAERVKAIVLSSTTEMFAYYDTDLRIQWANKAAGDSVGLTAQDLVGRRCYDVWQRRDQPCPECPVIKARETGKPHEAEQTTPDGRFWRLRGYPVFDEQGNVVGLVEFGQDITQREQAKQERERLLTRIQEQARQVQQIVDTVPEGVLLLDAAGQILLANPVAEENLIALANAKVGDTLTHLGDRPLTELLTLPPQGLWHEVNADERNFEVIARPMEPAPSQDWVLVIREMTQEREIERRVRQQERLAAVGQMAAGIAHDFNNILAVVALYARISLRFPDLPPKLQEYLEVIDQQAWRASELIQQILDFSRRSAIAPCPMDLLSFLKEQSKMLKRTLPENIQIELLYTHDTYTVNADPVRMQQALMNLVVNARDAMPEGGHLRIGLERIHVEEPKRAPLPEMRTAETEAGEWICLSVTDTGSGIPPDALPHIFDPFFTTKEPNQGTGLGLSQVYGIVKQHAGYIDVTSSPGQGTTFTLYLPALPVPRPAASPAEAEHLIHGDGQTILVVEDEAATRKALVESLELLNYQVLTATNGHEALTVFERHRDEIALVLSDLVMPGMGGQAVLRALRQQDPQVKVVFITGHPPEPLKRESENLQAHGLSGWITKPPSLEQLSQVVAQALNLQSALQAAGIRIQAQNTGGRIGRTVKFHIADGRVTVRSLGQPEKPLSASRETPSIFHHAQETRYDK